MQRNIGPGGPSLVRGYKRGSLYLQKRGSQPLSRPPENNICPNCSPDLAMNEYAPLGVVDVLQISNP